MNIGFITSTFPRFRGDLVGTSILQLAQAFSSKHRVDVLAPGGPEFKNLERWGDIEVNRFRYPFFNMGETLAYGDGIPANLTKAPWKVVQFPSLVRALIKEIMVRSRKWDIIWTHWLIPSGCCVFLAKKDTGIPVVLTLHSGIIPSFSKFILGRSLLAWTFRNADHIVAVSQSIAMAFPPSSKISVIPLGSVPFKPPPESKNKLRHNRGIGEKEFVVLFVGRFDPVKGLDTLLQACAKIPAVSLAVAGWGTDEKRIRKECENISARFLGPITGEEKATWFKMADILVLPSLRLFLGRTEGTPTVLSEAFSSNLPVVASAVGGLKEAIRPGYNGLLVPPDDPEALAEALNTLRNDKHLLTRLARGAYDSYQGFNHSRTINMYDKIFSNFENQRP